MVFYLLFEVKSLGRVKLSSTCFEYLAWCDTKKTRHCIRFIFAGKRSGAIGLKLSLLLFLSQGSFYEDKRKGSRSVQRLPLRLWLCLFFFPVTGTASAGGTVSAAAPVLSVPLH